MIFLGHAVIVFGIILLSYLVYMLYFTDFAKKAWEKKFFMGGILPDKDLASYTRAYKKEVIIMLIIFIVGYVLIIIK